MKKINNISEFINMVDNVMIGKIVTRVGEPIIRQFGDDITELELEYRGLLILSATIRVTIETDGMVMVYVHARTPRRNYVICVCTDDGKFPSKKAMESLVDGKPLKRHTVIDMKVSEN